MKDSAGNELKVGDEVTMKFKVVGISGEQGEFRNLHLESEGGAKSTRAVVNNSQVVKVSGQTVKAVDAK